VLGIDSAAPGFARVEIRPFLGKLTHVSGAIPHPKGEIAVTLTLDNGKLEAGVSRCPPAWKASSNGTARRGICIPARTI
jgi:hypothetical protein